MLTDIVAVSAAQLSVAVATAAVLAELAAVTVVCVAATVVHQSYPPQAIYCFPQSPPVREANQTKLE